MSSRIVKATATLAAVAGLIIPSTAAFAVAPADPTTPTPTPPPTATAQALGGSKVSAKDIVVSLKAMNGFSKEGDLVTFVLDVDNNSNYTVDGVIETDTFGDTHNLPTIAKGDRDSVTFIHTVTSEDMDRGYITDQVLVGAGPSEHKGWVESHSNVVTIKADER